jgi:hypothetical protein
MEFFSRGIHAPDAEWAKRRRGEWGEGQDPVVKRHSEPKRRFLSHFQRFVPQIALFALFALSPFRSRLS